MVDWQVLTLFLYIIARVSGFVLFNPVLGRSNLPTLFKAGFILVLSAFISSVTTQTVAVPSQLLMFSASVLKELLIGYILGLIMHLFFYIVQLAGQVIDTQMGLTMSQIYDASSGTNMSVNARFLNALMILLFFAANGHHTLLRILITSGEIVPFGGIVLNIPMLTESIIKLFVECTILGIKLSMPILVAELLGQLGMGVLMKVIPQINVFSINIELKVIIGFGLLLVLISPVSEYLLQAEMTMLESIDMILRSSAG